MKTFSLLLAVATVLWTGGVTSALARTPSNRYIDGVILRVDRQAREAEILPTGKTGSLKFTWARWAKFVKNGQEADASFLVRDVKVEVAYRRPFFGNLFVTKISVISLPASCSHAR